MKTRALVASLTMLLAVGGAWAQDTSDSDADAAEQVEPRRTIRVLENPYDLASFYRSSQGYGGDFGEASSLERYPIAGYYRNRPSSRYGYSRFWTNGYGHTRRPVVGAVMPYYNSIGQNGDLYLMAPTFLAPVGPLTGVFFTFGR
jgi:hypothetical protein